MGHAAEQIRRATHADLEAVPPHQVGEILGGVLHVSPRPGPRHAYASSSLDELVGPFRPGRGGPGGWVILHEPELHLDADVLVPDLAGWRIERMPELPETAYFTVSPDWVCEVLSPSTAALDRAEKMATYAREGVRHAWLLDPLARTLEVFALMTEGARRGWLLVAVHRDQTKVRAEPFEAIEIDLALLWSR